MLDVSGSKAGQLPLQLEPVPLAALATDVVAMVQPLARDHGVVLHAEALSGVAWPTGCACARC